MAVDLLKYCKLANNYIDLVDKYGKCLMIIGKIMQFYPHIVKECVTEEELEAIKLNNGV